MTQANRYSIASFKAITLQATRGLRHRNFRLFFMGQGISLVGTWMTRLATSWLVYRLTESALLLGLVTFSGQIVSFALQPLTGVWAERFDRHKIMIWTQFAAGLQSLVLATLTLTHVINLWQIILLSVIQGVINAVETPARQAFVFDMVDNREDLGNAIAINSSMQNGARLIGPAIAGVVIAIVGEGWCFFLDGVSYLPVVASLFMMRLKPAPARTDTKSIFEQMREGLDYVRKSRAVRSILILFALTSLMGYPYSVLMPVFATKILHGGPNTLGLLMGASGLGALISALSLTMRTSIKGLSRVIQIASGLLGLSLILFGLSTHLWLSVGLLVIVGYGLIQTATASNTIIQSIVPDNMRARVLSYYAMAFFGSAPLGSLLSGIIAEVIGAPLTIIGTGVFCLFGCLWFTFEIPKMKAAHQH
jgi:MFS family permease